MGSVTRRGDVVTGPGGRVWECQRRWQGAGRFAVVQLRAADGQTISMAADVVDAWPRLEGDR